MKSVASFDAHSAERDAGGPVTPIPISVIVCTRDRPQLLRTCLDALMRLQYPQFEVIVVDNAPSSDQSRGVVLETPFCYIREDRAGLDWARNRGLETAANDVVAYTDDDARPDPGWLWGLARGFARREVMCVTGLVLPAELETRAQRLYETYGTGMSRGFDARRFVPANLSWRDLIEVQRIGVGANMAFRREMLHRLGGFDTALDAGTPAGGAGDLDMFHRVLAVGSEIVYEPSALVLHRHRDNMDALRQQLYDNGKSYGVYLLKVWRTRTADRRALLVYVFGTRIPWLIGRLLRGMAGQHHLPVSLLWAELRGSMHSAWAYWQTYRRDTRIRACTNS
jgi:glycosyltransferase involved in cell wall biosynthesis